MQIVTYHSINAIPAKAWIAHIVLPNGDYWGVRFEGETEAVVIARAKALWEREQAKYQQPEDGNHWSGERRDGRGQHFVGKVWMINVTSREKIRIDAGEVDKYLANGWEKGGPRSK